MTANTDLESNPQHLLDGQDSDSDWDSLDGEIEDSRHVIAEQQNTEPAAPLSLARLAFALREGSRKPSGGLPSTPLKSAQSTDAVETPSAAAEAAPRSLKSNNPFLRKPVPGERTATSPVGNAASDETHGNPILESAFEPTLDDAASQEQARLTEDTSKISLLDEPVPTATAPAVSETVQSLPIPRNSKSPNHESDNAYLIPNPWAVEEAKQITPTQPYVQNADAVNVENATNHASQGADSSNIGSGKSQKAAILPSSVVDAPSQHVDKPQRSEHYQIKHVNWLDEQSASNPRRSPILIQNTNGPCPLLALVNSLVLTTPPTAQTALVEALRTREQVSLGLLLDAVFDELTSGRRGDTIPDVGDLYAFLITLHTGMNVNPYYLADPESLERLHANDVKAPDGVASQGFFENTKETKLYSAFGIPLLHGWLAAPGSAAHAALSRSAPSYEDAANIQFREEELEEKLGAQGLTEEEQQLYSDVICIKQFLMQWPTQLSSYGLDVLSGSLRAGQIAILFRNDHFSTLYKDPRSGRLMTLVTDAGYATHDEVVWESLVDVSGRDSELYSGDFRTVSSNQQGAAQTIKPAAVNHRTSSQNQPYTSFNSFDQVAASSGEDGWTTVQPRNKLRDATKGSGPGFPSEQETGVITSDSSSSRLNRPPPSETPLSPSTEQEDADLALALQMQEEEEELHRREQAAVRNRRNDEASQEYISRQHSDSAPSESTRARGNRGSGRSRGGRGNTARLGAASRREQDEELPTYEQAASDPLYIPGQTSVPARGGNVNVTQNNSNGRRASYGTGQSTYAQQSAQNQFGDIATGRRRGQTLINSATNGVGSHIHRRTASGDASGYPGQGDKCNIM